jgi:glycosyltransferase involved in cell wall biosynthesis
VIKVSAIVPVYNPGANIDDCIRSLVEDQTLARDEYEVIFVDDGSTDETPQRLDDLAARHDHVRVEHIPNSGWPGKPRNVGTDMARGEYVYFVDHDDWLAPDGLQLVHDAAQRDDADIVIGKVVGHGKSVPRGVFRSNREGLTIESPNILGLLTPHKLFRRSLLEENGIRFPEGRRRLEDHVFVMHAYFHARAITILADRPVYHWVMRDGDQNASYRPFDPVQYYEDVREVLDLVEEHTEPGALRDRLFSHWYRGKMLGRVGGRHFQKREPGYRRELCEEVRKLALERYDESVDAWLQPSMRVRSHLLREGDYDSLEALAEMEADLRAEVTIGRHRDEGDDFEVMVMPFEARLVGDAQPLRLVRRGDRLFWDPPDGVRLPEDFLEVTDDVFNAKVHVTLRSLADKREYVLPSTVKVRLENTDAGTLSPLLLGEVRVEPDAAAGSRLAPGRWEVLAGTTVVGFTAPTARAHNNAGKPVRLRVDESGQVVRKRRNVRRRGAAKLPPPPAKPSLKGRIARRVPWLARRVKRVRGGRRAAAPR